MASQPSPSSFLNERDRELLTAPTLSVREACRVLGIGKTMLYEAVRTGQVPSIDVATRVRIPTVWVRAQLRLDHIEGAPAGSVPA